MEIKNIPFDQYSRHLIVKNIIENVIKKRKEVGENSKLTILDVGGYKGITTQFMNNDSVKVLDVFDVVEDGYIKGDATNMEFEDDAFDIVCSFDVFEHIPRENRESFIKECARVSKIGHFIAAPMNDGQELVSYAEKQANNIFKTVNNEDHRWLKEHIEYGIPTNIDTESIMRKEGLKWATAQSNELTKWLLMQSGFFLKSVLDSDNNFLHQSYIQEFLKLHESMNGFYNKNYETLDLKDGGVAYRTVYFASENVNLVGEVNSYLKQTLANRSKKHEKIERISLELQVKVFETIAKTISLMQSTGNELDKKFVKEQEINSKLEREIIKLHKNIDDLNSYVYSIENSRSWKVTKPLRDSYSIIKNIKGRHN